MNVCVFLGSSMGNDKIYVEHVKKVAKWITDNGHKLAFGGANEGLMGVLARAVKDSGGYVIGVQAKMYSKKEYIFEDCDEYYVTKNVSVRKDRLIDISDMFIAFPGGTGSLDEIAHITESIKANNINKKLYIYNLNGYYDDLKKQFEKMIHEGFLNSNVFDIVKFINKVEEIK